jgi:hypothetical protein
VHVLATPPPPDTHTQLPSQDCNGHIVWVMEAGATKWTKLYGNAHIRLNSAVFWDIMLCHCVSVPDVVKDYCF